MEINKNVGYPYDTTFHNHTNNKQQISGQPTRQNVTLRRRCRSECLQLAPFSTTAAAAPLETTQGGDGHNKYNVDQTKNNSHQTTNRGHFVKHKTPPLIDNKRLYPTAIDRRNGNTLNGGHFKENIMARLGYSHDVYRNNDHGLQITDLRETYKKELENYRDRVKNFNAANSVNRNQYHNSASDKNKNTEQHSGSSPSDKLSETNKRRVRTRSESEPQEIFNSKPPSPNGVDKARGDDVNSSGLKRARDDDSPLLKPTGYYPLIAKETEAQNIQSNTLVNSHHAAIVNNHLTKSSVKLITKTNVVNGLIRTRIKRSPTPTFKTKPSSLLSTPRLKSTSPPPPPQPSQGVEIIASNLSETTDINTDKLSNDNDDGSDAEGSSIEDDDDDFIDIGEADSVEITDDEEDRVKFLNHMDSSLEGSSCAQNFSAEGIPGGSLTNAPLAPSLFPNCPPYITFASHLEMGPSMPATIQKVLKWKLTTITPIVVRRILVHSGFKLLKKTNDWMGIWGKHMKSPCFKTIRSYQKINHIPGTFQIGRKDRVWRNLQMQMTRHGKKEFNFMPRTYIIPQDLKMLRQAWPKYQQKNTKWIIKPPAAARGTGIKVVNRWSQIPKKKPLIVQKYIERPLLINGSKFDLRLYVLVTSINPLRVYMHTDGLARFASVKYSEKSDTLNDRYMHLTNYSINKLSQNYAKNEDANACKGHKWTVKSLWTYLAAQGINTTALWGALRNLVLRTVLAGEGPIYAMSKINTNSNYNCYELFGIDVILDSELVPWLLEVNISPSLHSASPLDMHVKGPLVRALLNTALYQVPPKLTNLEQLDVLTEQGLKGPLCYDKRIFTNHLSEPERIKHNFYANKALSSREDYLNTILENLTPDDVRCLLVSEDELARCAPLERIFPAPNSQKYLNFTDNPRYYNRLLDAWETRYSKRREEGIGYLQRLCDAETHLVVPTPTFRKDSSNEDEPDKKFATDSGTASKTVKSPQASPTPVFLKDSTEINNIKTIVDVINNIAVIQAQ